MLVGHEYGCVRITSTLRQHSIDCRIAGVLQHFPYLQMHKQVIQQGSYINRINFRRLYCKITIPSSLLVTKLVSLQWDRAGVSDTTTQPTAQALCSVEEMPGQGTGFSNIGLVVLSLFCCLKGAILIFSKGYISPGCSHLH